MAGCYSGSTSSCSRACKSSLTPVTDTVNQMSAVRMYCSCNVLENKLENQTSLEFIEVEPSLQVDEIEPLSPNVQIVPSCWSEMQLKESSLDCNDNATLLLSQSSETVFCRICHEGENKELLISPCRCMGTVGLVHLSCLQTWLVAKNTNKCEICNFKYAVEKRPKTLKEWFFQEQARTHRMSLLKDVFCFLLLAPLAGISAWLCLLGTKNYIKVNKHLEVPGLIGLTAFLLAIFVLWLLVAIKYHLTMFFEWRSKNQVIRVVNPSTGKVNCFTTPPINEPASGNEFHCTFPNLADASTTEIDTAEYNNSASSPCHVCNEQLLPICGNQRSLNHMKMRNDAVIADTMTDLVFEKHDNSNSFADRHSNHNDTHIDCQHPCDTNERISNVCNICGNKDTKQKTRHHVSDLLHNHLHISSTNNYSNMFVNDSVIQDVGDPTNSVIIVCDRCRDEPVGELLNDETLDHFLSNPTARFSESKDDLSELQDHQLASNKRPTSDSQFDMNFSNFIQSIPASGASTPLKCFKHANDDKTATPNIFPRSNHIVNCQHLNMSLTPRVLETKM